MSKKLLELFSHDRKNFVVITIESDTDEVDTISSGIQELLRSYYGTSDTVIIEYDDEV